MSMMIGRIFSEACVISSPSPVMMVSTLGRMFSAATMAESMKLFTSDSKSAFSSASPVRRLDQAAFVALTLPLIVVMASLAVVPVIPICVCTSWIALTMSE